MDLPSATNIEQSSLLIQKKPCPSLFSCIRVLINVTMKMELWKTIYDSLIESGGFV